MLLLEPRTRAPRCTRGVRGRNPNDTTSLYAKEYDGCNMDTYSLQARMRPPRCTRGVRRAQHEHMLRCNHKRDHNPCTQAGTESNINTCCAATTSATTTPARDGIQRRNLDTC